MNSSDGSFSIEKTIDVSVPADELFEYFIADNLLSKWLSPGAIIEPLVGGKVMVPLPGGSNALGEVLELDAPNRIVFTWGYDSDSAELSPGSSTVRIDLIPIEQDRTRITVLHILPVGLADRNHTVLTYATSRLAIAADRDYLAPRVEAALAAWEEAWNEPHPERVIARACTHDVGYRDDTVIAQTRGQLLGHIQRCQFQMPGVRLERQDHTLLTAQDLCVGYGFVAPNGEVVGVMHLSGKVVRSGKLSDITVHFKTPIPGITDGAAISGGLQEPSDKSQPLSTIEPHIWCNDLRQSLDFYRNALSFDCVASYPGDKEPTWHQLKRGEVLIMIAARPTDEIAVGQQDYLKKVRERIGHPAALSLYLKVDAPDDDLLRCIQHDVEIVEPIWEPFWGGRQFSVEDPDGQLWTITGPSKD